MSAETDTRSVHPSFDEYTDEEMEIILEHNRQVTWRVDDIEEWTRKRLEGKKGRGPHCPECEMKPGGVKEVDRHGDWGQVQHYQCLRCDHEFSGVRRYMYTDEDE